MLQAGNRRIYFANRDFAPSCGFPSRSTAPEIALRRFIDYYFRSEQTRLRSSSPPSFPYFIATKLQKTDSYASLHLAFATAFDDLL